MRGVAPLLVLGLLACKGVLRGDPDLAAPPPPDLPGPGRERIPPTETRPADRPAATNPLAGVGTWAYQIQGLTKSGAVAALVASHYDLLVLEPTRTDKSTQSFDSKGMVQQLHAAKGRLVLAYVDIGEAEDWRTYWKSDWVKPTSSEKGVPDFLVTTDPDGWSGNYPVAYWDPRWKEIVIHGAGSVLAKVLEDGYDGIYLDWVEAYANSKVAAEAVKAGKDPAAEMVAFIGEIRAYARARDPDFLVVPQNVPELAEKRPEYLKVVDGIAQEAIIFDGDADTAWSDPAACDRRVSSSTRAFLEQKLALWKGAGLPVFHVEYACDAANVSESYALSTAKGFRGYVTRRPLDRLTTTPPPGY